MAKKKLVVLIPMCNSDGCTKPAVYNFRLQIEVTNGQSSEREFIVDSANCCEAHEEELSK
jgi:hypothetical protein